MSTERPRGRRWRKLAFRLIVYYLVFLMVLAFFQRKLIYPATRLERITAADCSWEENGVFDVETATADGVLLRGWHLLPANVTCRTQPEIDESLQDGPVVLYFHGNGGNRMGREFCSRAFTEYGAHVFLFDYRGYGDNAGSPSETGLKQDAEAVWRYVTEERGVAPDRIVVYGESLGGGVACHLVGEKCRRQQVPAGLILYGTFSSLTETAAWHFPWLPVRLAIVDRYPSIKHAPDIACPIVQLHGTADEVVPYRLGKELFDAFPAQSQNGVAKEWIDLPGGRHNTLPISRLYQVARQLFARLQSMNERDAVARTVGDSLSTSSTQ